MKLVINRRELRTLEQVREPCQKDWDSESGRVEEWHHARRSGLSVAPRFLWVGIELGRAGREGGGLPSSPFRSARRVHNSTRAAFPEALTFARIKSAFEYEQLTARDVTS